MMRQRPLIALASCLVAFAYSANVTAADSEDILVIGENGLVTLRLHVNIRDDSCHGTWRSYVQTLFERLDTDKSGALSTEESKSLPTFQQLSRARLVPPARKKTPVRDADGDGQTTLVELQAFLQGVGLGPLTTQQTVQPGMPGSAFGLTPGQKSNSALRKAIDTNADNHLSTDELHGALAKLRNRDLDDDGTLSAAEFSLTPPQYLYAMNNTMPPSPDVVHVSDHVAWGKLVRRLVRMYDQRPSDEAKRDGKLTQEEIRLPMAIFQVADVDGDELLDTNELEAFLKSPTPCVEASVTLGEVKGYNPNAKHNVKTLPGTLHTVVERRSRRGGVTYAVGKTQIELVTAASGGYDTTQNVLAQFTAVDADKNKYVDKNEARRNYMFQGPFDLMDTDNDGKLFLDELKAYLNDQKAAAQSRAVVQTKPATKDLFQLLDLNRDQRLGRTEFAAGAESLKSWDSNSDGRVHSKELPVHFRLSVAYGQPGIGGFVQAFAVYMQAPAQAVGSGPAWFARMDRNNDGQVARREFLGSTEQFRKLDSDNNDHVSLNEATAGSNTGTSEPAGEGVQ